MSLIKKNEFFLLSEVVKRNFSAKYKDSTLGILWSVLQPLFTMMILTIVFSTLFSKRIYNYPVYLLCGKAIYTFFTGSCNMGLYSIRGNKAILLKTAAPKHIFIIGGVISEFFNFIIEAALLVIVMIVTHAPFFFNTMPFSIIPVISAFIFSLGLGFALSICQVYYTDTAYLWKVVTQLLFYGCAIFFPMDLVPEPFHQYMILNPVYWLVDQFRAFYIYGTFPNTLNIVNSLLVSVIVLVFGLIIFRKYKNKITMKF